MKTPYDTALRAIGREVDELRTSIGGAAQQLAELEALHRATGEAMVREAELAAGNRTFSPAPYLARARAERDRLADARRLADAELERLRREAVDRYGSMRALEGARDTFRDDAGKALAGAEQAGVDDIAGARFARALRARRAAGGRAGAPS